jgi:Cof subfamily protein (haloacid dehalogenase superfamily)
MTVSMAAKSAGKAHDDASSQTFPFKLAAVDLDGTLLAPDKTIPAANLAAVQKLNSLGCQVILASGRRHEDILPIYHELHLDAPIISSDGILVKQPLTEKVIYEQLVGDELTRTLISEGLAAGLALFVYHAESAFYSESNDLTHRYQAITRSRKPILHKNLHTLDGSRVHKVVWCGPVQKLLAEQKRLSALYKDRLVVCESDPGYLEFMPLLSGKYAALSHLAGHLGISDRATLAFGDNWNDVEILQRVGFGVAMTHGSAAARQAAHAVAPDGDEAESFSRGVQLVLDKFAPELANTQGPGL